MGAGSRSDVREQGAQWCWHGGKGGGRGHPMPWLLCLNEAQQRSICDCLKLHFTADHGANLSMHK
jgi:hypothetical protein